MIENKTTSDCTIYAFVGTAILAISLVVAMYVGNDFHQSLFVESIIFVGSNILLWAIFISMVNYPYELMTIGSNSKTKKNVVEAEPATEQEQPKQTLPQTESAQYSHEDYAKCVEAQEKEAREIKEKRSRTVLDYVHRTMSRFLYEEDLYKVIETVKEWSNDTIKQAVEEANEQILVHCCSKNSLETEVGQQADISFFYLLHNHLY